MFVAIFYGISAIWERDLGVLQRYLVSPAPRSALVLGKALSAGVRALSQALILYVLALLLGVGVDLHPLNILGVAAAIVLGSALFVDHCMRRKDARALHGDWPGADHADLLRQQRYLSAVTDADVVECCVSRRINGLLLDFGVLLAGTAVLTSIGARMYGRMGY